MNIDKEFKKLTKEYADDYFDTATTKLIKNCILLLFMVSKGEFKYDTYNGDRVLYDIKYAVNDIDI